MPFVDMGRSLDAYRGLRASDDLVGVSSNMEHVVSYLKSGTVILDHFGPWRDYLDDSKPDIDLGFSLLTDGFWIWSSELLYYLKTYAILLPSEFVDHMEKARWTVDEDFVKSQWSKLLLELL